MKNNKGLTLVALVITIIVLLILAGVSLNMIMGENGILTRATTVEVTYNKGEVIEEINILATEKYLNAYNEASAAGDIENFNNYYNPTKVINYFLGKNDDGTDNPGAKKFIEPLSGFTDTKDDTRYFIIISSLGRNIEKYAKGANNVNNNDYFYIKATKDDSNNIVTAKVMYKDLEGNIEEIGDLIFNPSL